MLFNSYEFLLFFPVVFALYWSMKRYRGVQNVLLLLASYLFYGWWDVRFLWLIAGMTATGYLTGRLTERFGAGSRAARMVCVAGVAVCLGVLGAFKYYDFFIGGLNEAMTALGWHFSLPLWQVVLPVGISFYTFQVISYVVDVYRGRLPACRDVVAFAVFVSFFPQLVAGPIERASHLLPQMQAPRHLSYAEAAGALRRILWGFAKKMLVADRCAPVVNAIFANPAADGTDLWMGTVLFAFQIYGDFSGYSDIAVGTARLFGIRLSRNFDVPYLARNVAEFWRRWHATLMAWLRDYVYIPLGGSRRGMGRTLLNTGLVFLASGLWHGANLTFVAWGLYHAAWFIPLVWLGSNRSDGVAGGEGLLPTFGEIGRMGATFFIVCVGWVFFRSETLAAAADHLGRMFTDVRCHTPYGGAWALLPPLLLMVAEWAMRHRAHGLDFRGRGLMRFRAARWAVYYALILAILTYGGRQAAFIYFQF